MLFIGQGKLVRDNKVGMIKSPKNYWKIEYIKMRRQPLLLRGKLLRWCDYWFLLVALLSSGERRKEGRRSVYKQIRKTRIIAGLLELPQPGREEKLLLELPDGDPSGSRRALL